MASEPTEGRGDATSRRRIGAGIVWLAALGLLAWSFWPAPLDPLVRGKPLSVWLDDRSTPPVESSLLSKEATEAVRSLGVEAIPPLLTWLSRRDPTFLRESIGLGWKLNLPIGPTRAGRDQDRAYRGFVALGPAARSAWPKIVELILRTPDRNQREAAYYSLPGLDRPTLQLLVDGTRHPDPAVRVNAAYALATLRDAPDEISLPALERLAGDPDPAVRAEATRDIRLILRELPNFVACLKDSSPATRQFGARHVGPFRGRALRYLPELEAAADDPDPAVQAAVAEAIRRVRATAP